MFTMTFVRSPSREGATSKSVLSVARYSVVTAGDRVMVWVYPTLREENPSLLELHKDENPDTYLELFVANEAGKTVDRHRAISLTDA